MRMSVNILNQITPVLLQDRIGMLHRNLTYPPGISST